MIVPSSGAPVGAVPFTDLTGKSVLLILNNGEGDAELIDIAGDFAKYGCRVVLAGNPLAHVQQARDQVRCRSAVETGEGFCFDGMIKGVELDISRGEQGVSQAVEEAWVAFASINILLMCNSVPGYTRSALEMREHDYDATMTANVKSSWLVSKAVASKMRTAGIGGSVLFITSITGTERGLYPGVSIYATSLAAIGHMAKALALELGKYGVRANVIACGLTEPDVTRESNDKESITKMARNVVPLQRWLRYPNDITGVLLWLASDSSSFVTGTHVIVDGGQSLRRPRMGEYRSRL